VVDDDRSAAPLGLAALAGIVDDEGIKMGDGTEGCFRPAFGGKRQGLAGQPFQIAMLAHMDDRLHPEMKPQPGIDGEIAVGRNQVGVVIAAGRVDVVAARRLHGDGDMAQAMDGQDEMAVDEEGILFGFAPALPQLVAKPRRQARREGKIVGERQALATDPAASAVGRPCQQPRHQRLAVRRPIVDPVSRGRHGLHRFHCAGRRIEADAIAKPAVAVRIIRQQNGHASFGRRRCPQARPTGGQRGDEFDAIGHRSIGDDGALGG